MAKLSSILLLVVLVPIARAAWIIPLQSARPLEFLRRNKKKSTFVLKDSAPTSDEKEASSSSSGGSGSTTTSSSDNLKKDESNGGDASTSSSVVSTSTETKNRLDLPSSFSNVELPAMDFLDDLELARVFDVANIKEAFESARENASQGELGTRGEVYFAAQALAVLAILCGGIPFVGDVLSIVCGPGFLLAGMGILAMSVQDLGSSLTPWVQPAVSSGLKTDGLYSKMRHPMYSGLIAVAIGFSTITGSVERLLLAGLLYYALDVKTQKEEERLLQAFPDYSDYMVKVPGKFVPAELSNQLPWSSQKQLPPAKEDSNLE